MRGRNPQSGKVFIFTTVMKKLTREECHKRLEGRDLRMIEYSGSSRAHTSYFICNIGITNNMKERMLVHKRNLGSTLDQVYEPLYFDSGIDAQLLESKWKQSPYITNIGIDGFKTECVLINSETTKMIFG